MEDSEVDDRAGQATQNNNQLLEAVSWVGEHSHQGDSLKYVWLDAEVM